MELIDRHEVCYELRMANIIGIINDYAYGELLESIGNIDIVDTMPDRYGEWIQIPYTIDGRERIYTGCSECHEPIPTDSDLDSIAARRWKRSRRIIIKQLTPRRAPVRGGKIKRGGKYLQGVEPNPRY